MPCGSAAPLEGVAVEDGVLEVWLAGVVVVAGVFCAESTMVDCDEERENVLEKGAPRWVSLSSVLHQLHIPSPLLTDKRLLLVSFHDMLVPVAVSRSLLIGQEVGDGVRQQFAACLAR